MRATAEGYLEQLRLAQERHALVSHAYLLMSNYYRLLLETPHGSKGFVERVQRQVEERLPAMMCRRLRG